MREILFRAKRKDNGEWIFGYYAKVKDYCTEKELHIIFPLYTELYTYNEFSGYAEILPETLGQYIGSLDRNGQKVFEGDILMYRSVWHNTLITEEIIEIGYEDCYFGYRESRTYTFIPIDDNEYGICTDTYTIIGNIHDNPELMKGD